MFERKLTSVSPWGTLSIVLALTGCLGLDQTVGTDETELPETTQTNYNLLLCIFKPII